MDKRALKTKRGSYDWKDQQQGWFRVVKMIWTLLDYIKNCIGNAEFILSCLKEEFLGSIKKHCKQKRNKDMATTQWKRSNTLAYIQGTT